MPIVRVAQHLCNQFAVPGECEVPGATLREVVAELDHAYPGVARYLLEDHGGLRVHVNLFIGDRWAQDRRQLSDPVAPDDVVYVMQALSGG